MALRKVEQRRRRNRRRRNGSLSMRGRITLAVGALVLLFAFGLALGASVPRPGSALEVAASSRGEGLSEPAPGGGLPSVSARPSAGPRRDAPAPLLSRLPVDRSAYDSILVAANDVDPATPPRYVEYVDAAPFGDDLISPLRIEYTFDARLTEQILRILRHARVGRGHVIVLDARTGRVLAYVATDAQAFPPTRAYPAASLVKVVTAAAALDLSPDRAREPCIYRGNPYRLTRARVHRPSRGHSSSLERAIALSNNQCFAQLAVEAVGEAGLLDAIDRFGWTESPARGHSKGEVRRGEGDYDLGRLGCGLAGCRITPLHAGQLATILAHGHRLEPWWIDRIVDGAGRSLGLPSLAAPTRVMSGALAGELREMLVLTTTRGTAKSAFRDRRGRPKLGPVRVAGKTGNLSGSDPDGRYEWFMGVAPTAHPTIAVAVLQAQGHLWWAKSSEVAADVLKAVFCERGTCASELADRFTGDLADASVPVFLSGEVQAGLPDGR